jgi:hypothetical protein
MLGDKGSPKATELGDARFLVLCREFPLRVMSAVFAESAASPVYSRLRKDRRGGANRH